MKALLITIILALTAGASVGMGFEKGASYQEPRASIRACRGVAAKARRANEGTLVLPPVTITAPLPRAMPRAAVRVAEAVKSAGPQMHCGPWRPLEQGRGNVRDCDVY